MKDILVYTGEGVGAGALRQLLATLTRLFAARCDIKKVDHRVLASEPWMESTALLVIPGGRDLPYVKQLNGVADPAICARGRSYLGICAGGYFGCRQIEFGKGTPLEIVGCRELGFFPGLASGFLFPGFVYDSEAGARAVSLRIHKEHLEAGDVPEECHMYYNGGCKFVIDSDADRTKVRSLADYLDVPPNPDSSSAIAIVECDVGKGKAILTGVHPEYDVALMNENDAHLKDTYASLKKDSEATRSVFRGILARLGLKTSEMAQLPPRMTHLGLACVTSSLGAELWSALKSLPLQDLTNKMGPILLADIENGTVPELEIKYPENEEDNDAAPLPPQKILFCGTALSRIPGVSFDSEEYFRMLRDAGLNTAQPFGSWLLYGEVVTSTQTILQSNINFTSALPDGFVFLAGTQLAGRGRGDNTWVSSGGGLQFSFVARYPGGTNAGSVVFIQYLAALACVEAVRSLPGYGNLNLRIKWPNDIYIVEEDMQPRLRKAGGILVTSNWVQDQFLLIIGCGINLNNAEPTDCINAMISRYNGKHGTSLELLSKEKLLARILSFYEIYHRRLIKDQSFDSFLPQYFNRWLHSNEKVILADYGDTEVCIEGITAQGFLKTRSAEGKVFELQPNGNSFDLMKNMIFQKK